MNKSTLIVTLIGGIILGSSLAASAQKPAGEMVSVSGCIERVQRDGSLSATAAGTTATPNTAGAEANSAEMVNAFRLKDATSVADKAATGKSEYALQEGSVAELGKHVGHRVQIAGNLLPSVAEQQTNKSKPAEGIRQVQVTGIKMIASKCETKP